MTRKLKSVLFLFLLIKYFTTFGQKEQFYLRFRVESEVDYTLTLDEFFVPIQDVNNRKEFNQLLCNDSLFLNYINDTVNRIYYHEDLVLVHSKSNKLKITDMNYKFMVPINDVIRIDVSLVRGNISYVKRKYNQSLQVLLFSLDEFNAKCTVIQTREINLVFIE